MKHLTNFKFHIIQVSAVKETDKEAAQVLLSTANYKQTITIPYTSEPGTDYPALESACDYLTKKGFDIVGYGNGQDCNYLISSTFKPISKR